MFTRREKDSTETWPVESRRNLGPLADVPSRLEVRAVFEATLRFKVPGAFLRFDKVKTESKLSEQAVFYVHPPRGRLNRSEAA